MAYEVTPYEDSSPWKSNKKEESTSLSIMSGMDTMKEVFFEMRNGINQLVDLAIGEQKARDLAQSRANLQGVDTDTTAPKPVEKPDFSILDSIKDAFGKMGPAGQSLLGIAALIAGMLLWNALADDLVKVLAPIMKFLGETLIPNLKELHQIILDQPGGYWTLLGAGGLGITLFRAFGKEGRLTKMFTSISKFIKDILDPKTLMFRENSKTWKYRLTQSISGRNGIIRKVSTMFDDLARAIRTSWPVVAIKELAKSWKASITRSLFAKGGPRGGGGLIPRITSNFSRLGAAIRGIVMEWGITKLVAGWKASITSSLFAKAGPRGVGGGLIPRITSGISRLGTAIRSITMEWGITKLLAGWKASITSSLFAKAGPRGGGGLIPKITSSVSRIATAIKGIFSGSSVLKIFDSIKLAGTKFASGMSKVSSSIGKTLGFISKISGLTKFLRLGLGLVKAVPVLGQIVMVIQGIFGFVKGAIEGWKTGGVWGAIKGGLIGLYDALIGNFLNLIFDVVGWILKKFGLEGLGDFFSNLDFSFEAIKNAVLNVVDTIRWVFHQVVNGLKKMANGVMAGLNWLPGIQMKPYSIEAFEPRKKETEVIKPKISIEFTGDKQDMPVDTSAADLEALEAKKMITKSFDKAKVGKIDYGDLNMPNAPVFAPVTQTGGDVFNQSTFQSPATLSSTHSDETAKMLSELTYS